MRQPFLPYGKPLIDDEDIAAVTRVLRSDMLTTGPEIPRLEEAFADAVGAAYAVACNSGTAALHLAAMCADLGQGTTAVVPSITFLATANAVRFTGADVVFADVDPDTGLMTPKNLTDALQRAESPVKAVFPVHLGGQTVDLSAIALICDRVGAVVIEDACHALGTEYEGRNRATAGTVGDCQSSFASTFSLHPVKTIAAGEGGVVTTNDKPMRDLMLRARNHGMSREEPFEQSDLAYGASGEPNPWYYEMFSPSFNYRLPDINAALASSQLHKLPHFVARRRELAERYDQALKAFAPLLTPVRRLEDCIPAWHLYQVLIDFERLPIDRSALMTRLRDLGIGTQVHYIPVHLQPYYAQQKPVHTLPGAISFYKRVLSLPLHVNMTDGDVDRVAQSIAQAIGY